MAGYSRASLGTLLRRYMKGKWCHMIQSVTQFRPRQALGTISQFPVYAVFVPLPVRSQLLT